MAEEKPSDNKSQDPLEGEFLREVIFGANDGVVTSIGFLVGIVGAVSNQTLIVISGVLTITAGAVSMALGNYLGVKSQNEFYRTREVKDVSWVESNAVLAGTIMGISYLIAGFPPLLPFIFIRPTARALVMSIILAVFVMGVIGFIRWLLNKGSLSGKIGETIIIGIIAAAIGFIAGEVLNLLGISGGGV